MAGANFSSAQLVFVSVFFTPDLVNKQTNKQASKQTNKQTNTFYKQTLVQRQADEILASETVSAVKLISSLSVVLLLVSLSWIFMKEIYFIYN